MDTQTFYDYIIVGAGILGCATAKYLKEYISPDERVLLVDKYPACGQGNTSKSNACYRNVFDTTLNIMLCNASIEYYKSIEEKFDVGLKEVGYLWLLTKEQMKQREEKKLPIGADNHLHSLLDFLTLQQVQYKILNQEEVQNIFPTLKLSDQVDSTIGTIEYGLLGYQCGTLAPDLLVKYYEQEYRNLKGEIAYGQEVVELVIKEKGKEYDEDYFPTVWRKTEGAGIRIKSVKTGQEQTILGKKIILCTGAWINQLLYKLGIHIGVNAKMRQLFRIKNKQDFVINKAFENKYSSIPFIILPEGGVFIKPVPQNGCVDVGCSDDVGRAFEQEPLIDKNYNTFKNKLDNPKAELEFYQTDVLPVLQAYFPTEFNEKVPIDQPSAGMYAYSLDKYPVITKELNNLFICTGASGSGIMKGDAIARINVANILGQDDCTLFNGEKIQVKNFGLHERKLPMETLIL